MIIEQTRNNWARVAERSQHSASVLWWEQVVAAGGIEFDGGVPGPVRVAQEFAGEHHDISVAAADGVFSLGWCGDHPACGHRNICFPADLAGDRRQEGRTPRNAGQIRDDESVADIEQVEAGGFEFSGKFDGFFESDTVADPVGDGEPGGEWQIFRPNRANGGAGFEEEPDTVFEAASVVVGAVIGEG